MLWSEFSRLFPFLLQGTQLFSCFNTVIPILIISQKGLVHFYVNKQKQTGNTNTAQNVLIYSEKKQKRIIIKIDSDSPEVWVHQFLIWLQFQRSLACYSDDNHRELNSVTHPFSHLNQNFSLILYMMRKIGRIRSAYCLILKMFFCHAS